MAHERNNPAMLIGLGLCSLAFPSQNAWFVLLTYTMLKNSVNQVHLGWHRCSCTLTTAASSSRPKPHAVPEFKHLEKWINSIRWTLSSCYEECKEFRILPRRNCWLAAVPRGRGNRNPLASSMIKPCDYTSDVNMKFKACAYERNIHLMTLMKEVLTRSFASRSRADLGE